MRSELALHQRKQTDVTVCILTKTDSNEINVFYNEENGRRVSVQIPEQATRHKRGSHYSRQTDTSVKVNHTPRQSSRGVSTQPRLGWRQRHHAVSIRRQGTKGKNSDSLPLTALIKAAGQCQNGPSSEVASSSTIRCAAGHTPRALVRWQSRRQNDQGNEGVRC